MTKPRKPGDENFEHGKPQPKTAQVVDNADFTTLINRLDFIPAVRHIPAPGVKAFVIGNVCAAADRDGVGGKGPKPTRAPAEPEIG